MERYAVQRTFKRTGDRTMGHLPAGITGTATHRYPYKSENQ